MATNSASLTSYPTVKLCCLAITPIIKIKDHNLAWASIEAGIQDLFGKEQMVQVEGNLRHDIQKII